MRFATCANPPSTTRRPAIRPAKPQASDAPKACDALAARLRRQILVGDFADDAPLPPERTLVEQTGLSRGSVREALRILEAEGLVATRPGRNGGTRVRRPSGDSLARHLGTFVAGQALPLAALLETREVLEPLLAELAATRRTPDDLARLGTLAADLEAAYDDIPGFLEANVAWHLALAAATHNPLLEAFIGSISRLIHASTAIENVASDDVRSVVISAHRRILQAIEKRDPAAARRRMERHVRGYTKQVGAVLADPHGK